MKLGAFILAGLVVGGGVACLLFPARHPRLDAPYLATEDTLPGKVPLVRLPSPQVPTPAQETSPLVEPMTRMARLEQLMEQTRISPTQVEPYVEANRRSAGSLLAAAGVTGDRAFLEEAMQRYPNDPRVAYTGWFRSESPEEKRKWLEAMKTAEPENALASYLLANELLKAGRQDEALVELQAAYSKGTLSDHALESIQDHEDAYRAAGLTELDAKALAGMGHLLPYLAKLKELGRGVTEIAQGYRAANDPASADALIEMALQLGQRLSSGQKFLIEELVGMAIETQTLKALEPNAMTGRWEVSAAERLQQLAQQKELAKSRQPEFERLLESAPDADLIQYFDRVKLFGELAASEWLRNRHSPGP